MSSEIEARVNEILAGSGLTLIGSGDATLDPETPLAAMFPDALTRKISVFIDADGWTSVTYELDEDET